MLRAGSSLCLFCDARLLLRPLHPQWLQARDYATRQAQQRRPAREQLSDRVSRTGAKLSPKGKSLQRHPPGAFGGMNRTRTNLKEEDRRKTLLPQRKTGDQRRREKARPERRDGEYRALKMQQTLSNMPYERRNAIKEKISAVDSFEQFSLLPIVRESIASQALQGMADISPTPIQRVAIPTLLRLGTKKTGKMQQYLLAAETGSGKTLAYLIPIIDHIKRIEAREKEDAVTAAADREAAHNSRTDLFAVDPTTDPASNPNPAARPRAIVLVPTAELVAQVTMLAKSLCHTVKFRVAGISAAISATKIRNQLFPPRGSNANAGVDLLVSTPHLLNSIAQTEPMILSRVRHLVIDEADSLFDRSFAPETSPIIDRATPSLEQLVLCSATIPKSLDNYVRKQYPAMQRLVTPNLHAIPRRVQLGVVEVDQDPYRGNKKLACADTIWTIGKSVTEHAQESDDAVRVGPDDGESGVVGSKEKVPVKRIIVFVNERETAKELTEYLNGKGIEAVALSRETEEAGKQAQAEALAEFTGIDTSVRPRKAKSVSESKDSEKGTANFQPQSLHRRQPRTPVKVLPNTKVLSNTKVLVATDLGSRGIDTTAVRHVILYDCPHTTIDFIHRLGRTGRMGRRGRGIVLVGKGDRKDVVREVREGMYLGKALI